MRFVTATQDRIDTDQAMRGVSIEADDPSKGREEPIDMVRVKDRILFRARGARPLADMANEV